MGTSSDREDHDPPVSEVEPLFFKVENVKAQDVFKKGKMKVKINEEEVALIAFQNTIYAIKDKCPHYGGPLHQGDIEDFYKTNTRHCIKCPWHSWRFELTTGKCLWPTNRVDAKNATVYPVRVDPGGGIHLGFSSFAPEYFNTPPD